MKLLRQWHETKTIKPKPMGGYRKHILTPHKESVLTILKEKPDITLKEFTERLARLKIKISASSLDRFLNHLGQGYKKNGSRQ